MTVAFLTVKQNIIIRVCELTRKILEGQEGREEGRRKRRGILITEMRPGMGKVRTFSALLSLTLRRKEEERNSER